MTTVLMSVTDSKQYTAEGVHRYERIFGQDFISTGGLKTTKIFCRELGLKPGARVLDIGSGLGGSAFHMAQEYGAHVTGIDVLPQMVQQATRRVVEREIANVSFIEGDIMCAEFDTESFDCIYSRDALLHVEDKAGLFRRVLPMLAPGGQLFITDYGTGADRLSDEFLAYVDDTGYFLTHLEGYREAIASAGFENVVVEDRTDQFVSILREDIEFIRNSPGDLGTDDQAYLIERWERKIVYCDSGDMKWAAYRAYRNTP